MQVITDVKTQEETTILNGLLFREVKRQKAGESFGELGYYSKFI